MIGTDTGKATFMIEVDNRKTDVKIAGSSVAIVIGSVSMIDGLLESLEEQAADVLAKQLTKLVEEYKERA